MFLLDGVVARYLFVPLAEAVVFCHAGLVHPLTNASFLRLADCNLLKAKHLETESEKTIFGPSATRGSKKGFRVSFENAYSGLLTSLVAHRKLFIPAFLGACLCGVFLVPWLGQDFFS